MRYFVAVAEAGHFGRAAKRLFVAQPSLSQQIHQLEAGLGLQLLLRHPRGATLTPAGEAFLADARRALRVFEEAVQRAQAASRAHGPTLRIGFLGSAANELTPAIRRSFERQHPNVTIQMRQFGWDDPHVGLGDGLSDLSYVRLPINDPEHIAFEPLLSEPCVLVVASGHPLATRASVSVGELLDEPFCHNQSPPGPFRDFWLVQYARTGDKPPRVGGEFITVDEWLEAIVDGQGVSVAPLATGRFYPRPGVSFVPITDARESVVAVAWRREDDSALVRSFVANARAIAALPHRPARAVI